VPNLGWSFAGWSGDVSGSMNPTTIVMDGNKTVTATFTQNVYSLDVNVVGSGCVSLNNLPPYHYGDVVELTATPSSGWIFDHWSGDLSGSANPTTILITGDKSVTATFIPSPIVGGYSVNVPTCCTAVPVAAYSLLICMLGTALVALKRKRR